MKISHEFDSGSIEVVAADEPMKVRLKLKPDNKSDIKQWFHFKLDTVTGKKHQIKIMNAGESSFSNAWKGYRAVASYDRINWFRVTTAFDGKELTIEHTPENSNIYYAYFAPYDSERHNRLIATARQSVSCVHTRLGLTNDNNSIDLLIIGKEDHTKKKIWLIARQHPGETMAEWFIEGTIKRLLSNSDTIQKLLQNCVFYIVPNMNPDGSIRGNHRTNSKGFNLNREWAKPSKTNTPEVFYVQRAMLDKGVDFFIDIHGDEEIPYNFIMGAGASCHVTKQVEAFKQDFVNANSDFQLEVDYDSHHSGKTSCCGSSCGQKDLSKANHYVEDTFGCVSLVLEMPFIDNANAIDKVSGWSGTRSFELGYSALEPIYQHLERLS